MMGDNSGQWSVASGRCAICPRRCNLPRGEGFCGAPWEPQVASVCLHRGEEPPLNPIVNIFFSGCNLQCIYCQNWQISDKGERLKVKGESYSVETLVDAIAFHLWLHKVADHSSPFTSHFSTPLLGFVTAAHYVHLVRPIVEALREKTTPNFTVVYNSSSYESVEALRSLEGVVDIYLPDLKYMDSALAARYSHAPDYPAVAAAAIAEMRRQVGATLKVDDSGTAYRGLLVRHLVLPGALDNTRRCLEWLADNLPPTLSLSLMAQYFPPRPGLPAPLDRTLTPAEYDEALAIADRLGFLNVYTQQLDSTANYRPDFQRGGHPFEP